MFLKFWREFVYLRICMAATCSRTVE